MKNTTNFWTASNLCGHVVVRTSSNDIRMYLGLEYLEREIYRFELKEHHLVHLVWGMGVNEVSLGCPSSFGGILQSTTTAIRAWLGRVKLYFVLRGYIWRVAMSLLYLFWSYIHVFISDRDSILRRLGRFWAIYVWHKHVQVCSNMLCFSSRLFPVP